MLLFLIYDNNDYNCKYYDYYEHIPLQITKYDLKSGIQQFNKSSSNRNEYKDSQFYKDIRKQTKDITIRDSQNR